MDILVTGANGFLGNIFYKFLIKDNKVSTLSRFNSDYCFDLSNSIPFFSKKFNLVIHAAGISNNNSINSKYEFYLNNFLGTKNLLTGLSQSFIPDYLVFISSVSVYGLSFGNLIKEDAELNALDPYGESKILAENLIKEWCLLNNVKCTILRLPLVISSKPFGNFKNLVDGIKRGFYFNIGNGQNKKSVVFAEDVACCLLKVSQIGGVYNLTDGYHPSINEFSSLISNQLGKKKPINIPLFLAKMLAKIGDLLGKYSPFNTKIFLKLTNELTFDDTKARINFGWNPSIFLSNFKLNKNI
jgi:nucleoside-diphosphate-sugar epimerase